MFHMDFNREKREVYDPNGLNFVQGPSLISVCPRTYVSDVVDPHEYDTNNSCIPVAFQTCLSNNDAVCF